MHPLSLVRTGDLEMPSKTNYSLTLFQLSYQGAYFPAL